MITLSINGTEPTVQLTSKDVLFRVVSPIFPAGAVNTQKKVSVLREAESISVYFPAYHVGKAWMSSIRILMRVRSSFAEVYSIRWSDTRANNSVEGAQ